MTYILNGFKEAIQLILSFDAEIFQIVGLSLFVSFTATALASLVGIPLGFYTGICRFVGKRVYAAVLFTCMSIPPVILGLIVALFLSRRGPLGQYELLFSPTAMVMAQFLLVLPIVTGIIFGTAREKGTQAVESAKIFGANRWETLVLLIKELWPTVVSAVMTAFGRALSEVGAVMLVGGNIKGQTRVMTTFIAMNNSMGEYEKSIAMAIILLTFSLLVNLVVHGIKRGSGL